MNLLKYYVSGNNVQAIPIFLEEFGAHASMLSSE